MRLLLALFLSLFWTLHAEQYTQAHFHPHYIPEDPDYPTDSDSAYLFLISPHLIPHNHPLKPVLDSIFFERRVIETRASMEDAGFVILEARQKSFALIAEHPAVPGYLFKIYSDDAIARNHRAGWKWLLDRCRGAAKIRTFIKKRKMHFFTVPDKWLYLVPHQTDQFGNPIQQPVILIATKMPITSKQETEHAWKTVITKKHLNELYYILSHGSASTNLIENIPYMGNGQFSFIDTEYPKRALSLKKVSPYLSKKAKVYWEKLP